ncbi:MAG: hypothetical protein V4614_17125 [Pseudomonadota bacterium]
MQISFFNWIAIAFGITAIVGIAVCAVHMRRRQGVEPTQSELARIEGHDLHAPPAPP